MCTSYNKHKRRMFWNANTPSLSLSCGSVSLLATVMTVGDDDFFSFPINDVTVVLDDDELGAFDLSCKDTVVSTQVRARKSGCVSCKQPC